MTTGAKSLVSPALLARGFGGRGSDFEIYTAAAVADEETDLPIVRMVGSSTVKDLQGDIMSLTALQDMANGNPDLVIFLNHEYRVPDDIFGKLYGKPEIHMKSGIADLHLAALADLSRDEPGRYPHSKAYDTYTQIKKGKIRLGSSVGCQVTQYQFLDPDDFFSGILIEHVVWVEHSIVGVPASQRAWVEQAVKGLFERSLIKGDADEARQLAPAMKSLWDGPYDTILREIESEGLRRDLARVRPRGTGPQRILFDFTQHGFVLAGPKNLKKSLTIEEVDELLGQANEGLTTGDADEDEIDDAEEVIDTTNPEFTAQFKGFTGTPSPSQQQVNKSASGKTSWPLMSIGTEWTGSKAEKQIFDWASNEQDEIVASKARQCFLWYDPDNSDKQNGYKMPYTYIVDGSPKIVPLGVRACAGVLAGGMGGGHFGGDDSAMKAKVKTMYGRINREFSPDPEWVVPWEKDEKDASPDVVKEIADSESDSALNRQDLGEVEVNEDGTHEPMMGRHSHRHSDGQGGTHEHEHEHNDDANHHAHSHAEKQQQPSVQKASAEVDENANSGHGNDHPKQEVKDAGMVGCGCCDNCTGEAGCTCCDECTMQKKMKVDEGSNHSHDEGAKEKSLTINEQRAAQGLEPVNPSITAAQPTPEQLALLGVYNSIGKQLGFPVHTLTTKCDLVPTSGDAEVVRTVLASLDDVSDEMMVLSQRNDYYVDTLMKMMGVPDVNDTDNDDDEGGNTSPMSMRYTQRPNVVKEGRELSSKNRAHLQLIHDTVAAMHPDACKGMSGDGTSHQDGSMTVEEAQEEARQMGQGDSYSNLASHLAETTRAVLLRAFEGVEAKSLVEASIQKAVDAAMTDARANLDLLQREQQVLMQQVGKLANMPLGRPTNLQRSVTPASPHALDNVVSYDEMLSVAGIEAPKQQTLQEALAQTSVVEVPIVRGSSEIRTQYRHWPEGVGGAVGEGVRPPLTAAQKTLMHYLDWSAYNGGGEVNVPLVDDPADRV